MPRNSAGSSASASASQDQVAVENDEEDDDTIYEELGDDGPIEQEGEE